MTIHCSEGDKPIVKYRFQGDASDRIYKIRYSPVEVTVKSAPVEATSSYSNEGFQITFYSPNNFKNVVYVVRDYRIVNKGYLELNNIPCNGKNFNNSGPTIDPSTIVINSNIKCPPPNSDNQRCSIEISHKGIILFQDQGNCPVNYDVQCGRCPDGQHECESKIYPYYCCNDCGDTAQKIRDIAAKVGR